MLLDSVEVSLQLRQTWKYYTWARIRKRLRSPEIDSNESIPPAYVAGRAGTTTLFLAPIGGLKIPTQIDFALRQA